MFYLREIEHYGSLFWEKAVLVLLIINTFHSVYTAVEFFLVQYPDLEQKFAQQLIDAAEMRAIITEFLALVIISIISITLAIRLTKSQEKVFRYVELVLGTIFIFSHQHLTAYLTNIDYAPLAQTIRTWLESQTAF